MMTTSSNEINPVLVEMGAETYFDYSGQGTTFRERLTHCYQYGALAFMVMDESAPVTKKFGLPEPQLLVHGSWHGPEAPNRINHCWVVLSDGRIWEPITAMIYDSDKFYEYTRGMINALHTRNDVHWHTTVTGHWGSWPERG